MEQTGTCDVQTAFVVNENVTKCSGSGFLQCLDNSTSKYQHNVLSMTEKCNKQLEYQANLDDMKKMVHDCFQTDLF